MGLFKSKKRKALLSVGFLGLIGGLLLSLPATEVIHKLSSDEFCASCHAMDSVVETFEVSVHGGANSQGFSAQCVDCHLPSSNVVDELYVKGTSGIRHMWGHYVLGITALDYDSKHAERTDYVFDSGCLSCHTKLEDRAVYATTDSPVSDQVHNIAFELRDSNPEFQCASCHYDIAHPDLKRTMRLKAEQRAFESGE